jgi:hypothetical protein
MSHEYQPISAFSVKMQNPLRPGCISISALLQEFPWNGTTGVFIFSSNNAALKPTPDIYGATEVHLATLLTLLAYLPIPDSNNSLWPSSFQVQGLSSSFYRCCGKGEL